MTVFDCLFIHLSASALALLFFFFSNTWKLHVLFIFSSSCSLIQILYIRWKQPWLLEEKKSICLQDYAYYHIIVSAIGKFRVELHEVLNLPCSLNLTPRNDHRFLKQNYSNNKKFSTLINIFLLIEKSYRSQTDIYQHFSRNGEYLAHGTLLDEMLDAY